MSAIPYLGLEPFHLRLPALGAVPIDPWALLVFTGVILGLAISRNRGVGLRLDPRDVVDGALWTVGAAFVFGHLVEVLAYEPERLRTEGPWTLLAFWQGQSSYGGFLGAVVGSVLFYRLVRPRDYFRHADAIAYGLPVGWLFGRAGCALVHDHVGRRTDFPLAMDFDHALFGSGDPAPIIDGVRHELGLYEFLLMIPVVILFTVLGRRERVPGFFLGLFAVLYAPVRFGLDFLRQTDLPNPDPRWLGLTPGQYASGVLLAAGIALLATRDWRDFQRR